MLPPLLRRRELLFCGALAAGLLGGRGAVYSEPLVLPVLAGVMTLACLGVSGAALRSAGSLARVGAAAIGFSYVLLGGVFLLAASLFRHDPALHDGLVLLAAVPPGIAVIPFTGILDGDREFSLAATALGHLAALVVAPAIGWAVWGTGLVPPTALLRVLALLVGTPLVAAHVLTRAGLAARLIPLRGTLTNGGFALVIYTVVGVNREFLVANPAVLLPLGAVAATSTFGLGSAIAWAGRRRGARRATVASSVLLATVKNYGLASGLALALFGGQAALPAAVAACTALIPYMAWLEHLFKRRGVPGVRR